jgi:hypothetical protein
MLKYVKKASKYLNINAQNYKNIFNKYTETNTDINSKEYFMRLIKLFIKLQEVKKFDKIKNELKFFIKLFKKLFSIGFSNEHKKNIKVMLYFLKLIYKDIDCTSNTVSSSNTNSMNLTSSFDCSDGSHSFNDNNSKDSHKNSSCESSESSTSVYDDHENGSSYFFKKHKDCFKDIIKKIQKIVYIFKMLNIIFTELQRNYVQKINCYNLYDLSIFSNLIDVEFHNKLIQTIFNQTKSLLEISGGGIFNQESDTQSIDVFLKNGSIFTLCIVDNLRVRLETVDNIKTLILDVGSSQFSIKFISESNTNDITIMIMKDNFAEVKKFIYSLFSNKKSINHWVKILKKNNMYC